MRNGRNDNDQNTVLPSDEPGNRERVLIGKKTNTTPTIGNGKRNTKHKKAFVAIAVDAAIAALIILGFYLSNFVVRTESVGERLPGQIKHNTEGRTALSDIESEAAATQTISTPANPTESSDSISWRVKFADRFTNGAVEKTDASYKSANINVSISKVRQDDATCFLADIYVADINYFKTAFAVRPDVMGERELTNLVAKENNAILAINGDHCLDNNGPVVRNGKLYRDEAFADALVMNHDGSMESFSADQLDMNAIKANGAWQVWTFGPMLLKDGQRLTEFDSTLKKANPRTAIGYYEPGHYCFLVVDGRQPGYSEGMTLQEMSNLFYDLGCKVAFNLDGGQSSEMVFLGNVVNQPYNGGRSTSDILYISDD